MALKQRLDLRQSQTLVMTPQLQQAIKLLQMNNLELSTFVTDAVERNPLLEQREDDPGPVASGIDAEPGPAIQPSQMLTGGIATAEQVASSTLPSDDQAPLDADYGNVFDPGDGDAAAGWSGGDSDGDPFAVIGDRPSLRDHLLEQIGMSFPSAQERLIAAALATMLDETGYLTADLAVVARQLDCPLAQVEAVLAVLQGFDPPGIFARSLRECLAIQLRERDRLDPAMAMLLENLELIAQHRTAELMRRCEVDAEDMAEMLAELRALNPRPASAFDTEVTVTVVPDVLMRRDPTGKLWTLELNAETLPRVLVNRRYYAVVRKAVRRPEEKAYLSDQLAAANWLIRALDQRANTILKVASEIVRQQDGFFTHGVSALRPLTMREVAAEAGVHESTVSRVTTAKYIATPRGTFELRYFFTQSIAASTSGGEAHAAESVRHRIRTLIGGETLRAVLSDDQLVVRLRAEGIDIARRTVTKYREAMRIPSSVERRRRMREKNGA